MLDFVIQSVIIAQKGKMGIVHFAYLVIMVFKTQINKILTIAVYLITIFKTEHV